MKYCHNAFVDILLYSIIFFFIRWRNPNKQMVHNEKNYSKCLYYTYNQFVNSFNLDAITYDLGLQR